MNYSKYLSLDYAPSVDFVQKQIKELEDSVAGYESPIKIYTNQMAERIMEQREDGIYTQIISQTAIDVDKEELKKALAYDRDQFRQGYEAGRADGYAEGSQDILHAMIDILKENGYKVELDD